MRLYVIFYAIISVVKNIFEIRRKSKFNNKRNVQIVFVYFVCTLTNFFLTNSTSDHKFICMSYFNILTIYLQTGFHSLNNQMPCLVNVSTFLIYTKTKATATL